MVNLATVQAFNDTLKSITKNPVAVVVGGTNGIGKAFLQQFASKTSEPKIYFLGRKQAVLDEIKQELLRLNPNGTYIPIESGDLTLLSNVEAASKKILQQEEKVDVLFQSQGYLSFASRNESSEGLDRITTVRFYGRTRLAQNLLPLLNAASSPRYVSINAGGMEGNIIPDDLDLKDPQNYSIINAANAAATYTTLSMEMLQKANPKISFVHKYPGLVRTNLMNTEHFNIVARVILGWVVMPVFGRLFGMSAEEAGMRALYAAFHPQFGAQSVNADANAGDKAIGSNGMAASGVYTLNGKDEAVHNDKILKPLREQGLDEKIWEHTVNHYQRILN